MTEFPTPFCTVRLKPNGKAADVVDDEQSAEMWAYGIMDLFTEDQLRVYADALDAAEAKLEAARVALEAADNKLHEICGSYMAIDHGESPQNVWESIRKMGPTMDKVTTTLATLKQP